MIKIVQVTDTHLMQPGDLLFGIDPLQRFNAAIDDIACNQADADLCVLTGDIIEDHGPATYAALQQSVARLPMPLRIIPGNHDRRELLAAAFPGIEQDGNGFQQSTLRTEAGLILFLDTVDAGRHTGLYCDKRAAWLRERLDAAEGAPAYIFMHHPPFAIGLRHLDGYAMQDGDRFGELLDGYDNVRHIFFGHVHRAVSGSWRGVPFSALPSTNHQCLLDLKGGELNVCTLEAPAYGIILIDGERTIVHTHSYLDDSPRYAYFPEAVEGEHYVRL